jgi:hypothetical protein
MESACAFCRGGRVGYNLSDLAGGALAMTIKLEVNTTNSRVTKSALCPQKSLDQICPNFHKRRFPALEVS